MVIIVLIALIFCGVASASGGKSIFKPVREGEVINDTCPVMGGKVEKDTPYKIEYKGKTIGFCCPGCIEQFNADPEKYIKKIGSPLSGELENGVRVVEVKAFKYGFDPDPIVVKKGERVKLEVSSLDVTHGLGIKQLGINLTPRVGETKTAEFIAEKAGDFHIHCTVYCGSGHGNMHGNLKIVD
jgi:nitrosocyanin